MAKACPDSSTDNQGDFASDGGNITGFSHMHDAGTGGVRLISTQTIEYNNSDEIRHSHWEISLFSQIRDVLTMISIDVSTDTKIARSDITVRRRRPHQYILALTSTTASKVK
jgi:hypothetical protein